MQDKRLSLCICNVHVEKYFPNCIESNPNQIIFTIHRLISNSKRTVPVCCSKRGHVSSGSCDAHSCQAFSHARIFWTQRSLFEIVLNQTEIRLYLTWTEWLPWIIRFMVNTIWFRGHVTRIPAKPLHMDACFVQTACLGETMRGRIFRRGILRRQKIC